jgi:bifunctional non-homologous end joining protein LigD
VSRQSRLAKPPAARQDVEVEVEGRRLKLSNLDKVLYPAVGFTKGEVIDYYTRIAPVLLPHLRGRPLTMKRYPDGVDGKFFYEKQCPSHRPEWVHTEPVVTRGKTIDFCVVDDLATLVWTSNLADLELHTSLSRADDLQRPTMVVFDLDPGAPAAVLDCAQVGIWLRDVLGRLGLESFVKTSGSKGLHFYIPLNTPATYEESKPFARALARLIEKEHPKQVTSNMKKELRKGKVFIDWSQNNDFKTTVCVYSLRARERPTVSTPVTWDEVEDALADGEPDQLVFEAREVLEGVEQHGDLFEPVLELEQELPELS